MCGDIADFHLCCKVTYRVGLPQLRPREDLLDIVQNSRNKRGRVGPVSKLRVHVKLALVVDKRVVERRLEVDHGPRVGEAHWDLEQELEDARRVGTLAREHNAVPEKHVVLGGGDVHASGDLVPEHLAVMATRESKGDNEVSRVSDAARMRACSFLAEVYNNKGQLGRQLLRVNGQSGCFRNVLLL